MSETTREKFFRMIEQHFKIEITFNTQGYLKNLAQLTFYVTTQVNKPYE